MRSNCNSRTTQLVNEAREACLAAEAAAERLKRVRAEAAETIRLLQWWRFFDWDPRAAEFLESLDLKDGPVLHE